MMTAEKGVGGGMGRGEGGRRPGFAGPGLGGQGHELVDLGIENQGAGNARPFLRFNPTRWIGSRRILIAATSSFNPCIRVAIGGQSVSLGPEVQPADAATREIRVRTGAERTRRLTTETSQ